MNILSANCKKKKKLMVVDKLINFSRCKVYQLIESDTIHFSELTYQHSTCIGDKDTQKQRTRTGVLSSAKECQMKLTLPTMILMMFWVWLLFEGCSQHSLHMAIYKSG